MEENIQIKVNKINQEKDQIIINKKYKFNFSSIKKIHIYIYIYIIPEYIIVLNIKL